MRLLVLHALVQTGTAGTTQAKHNADLILAVCLICFCYCCSAGLHSSLTRQQQVLTAWHAEAARRIRLRELVLSSLQRWRQLALSRAFEQWKHWALHKAALQRKARAVISLLAGHSLQWAFCMMR
jgi:hypothetical protein